MEPHTSTILRVDSDALVGLARRGSRSALGKLLGRYRRHLGLLVEVRVGRRLREKLDVDDLLQEVALEAHREIGRFRGRTEREFLAWLRQLLATTVSNQVRHYLGTLRRDPGRERPIFLASGDSRALDRNLVATQSSPSQRASHRERAAILSEALRKLPEAYREVLVLRQIEELTFPEVARRMGRSEDSVRNLWVRALARLRPELEGLR